MSKVLKVTVRFWHEGTAPMAVFLPEALDEPEGLEVSVNDNPYHAPTMTAWEIKAWLEDSGFVLKNTTLGDRRQRPVWAGQYTLVFRGGAA